jgi:NodT family efflux transporter outer membrane factor (OMF) lipoprotein
MVYFLSLPLHKDLSRTLPLILLVSLLSGCSAVPTRETPPVAAPERFSQSGGERVVPERWWLDLADPSLDRLVEQALAHNFSLRAAWARLRQAEAVARREGAARLPTLDLKGNLTRSDGSDTQADTSRQLGLYAGYEVDLWGRVKASADAAALDAQASQADLRTAALSLSATLADTWYQLVEQRSQIALISRQLDINRQLLELIEGRFRSGQASASDVYRQRQLQAQTEGEMAQAETRLKTLEHQLLILLGSAPGSRTLPGDEELPELLPLPATGLPSELLTRRPDLQAALLRLQASDARAAAAVANRYPRLDLSAALITPGATGGVFDGWLGNLVAQLTAPLIDGGERRAEVARTEAVVRESLNDYAQTLLEALGEVEDALVAEAGQRRYLATIDAQLEALKTVATQEGKRYFQGDADYLSVLDAMRSRQSLERQQVSARRELISDRIALVTALAGGWSMISEDEPQ